MMLRSDGEVEGSKRFSARSSNPAPSDAQYRDVQCLGGGGGGAVGDVPSRTQYPTQYVTAGPQLGLSLQLVLYRGQFALFL